jgi:signal peptidase I
MFTRLLKNKVFRVSVLLLVITFPFTSKYRFVKTVGESMEPTLRDGEWVVIERSSSLGGNWFPARYDNIVIKDEKEKLSKRVIGLPGDTIEIKEGVIYLNNKILKDPFGSGRIGYYLVDENDEMLRYFSGPDVGAPVIKYISQGKEEIPDGYVWVIGDNREDSWFGLLPIKNITGKILY